MSVDEAKVWLSSMEPYRPFCLIANWCWLDLDVPREPGQLSNDTGDRPALVYSSNVLFDSRHRFPVGGWVRSTLLVRLKDEFVFETRNTRYVLMGSGSRRTTSPDVVNSLC
ncbi:DUF6957 family protein [Pseudomonas aeruginosa]|uniref:DUF6957 family protein n=1 Tax=Pseudomonas aeruginosa TaxID=287 RepID=UPI003D3377EA